MADGYGNDEMIRQQISNTITDLVADLMYYDRKEDDDLPLGAIEKAIEDGIITEPEMVMMFAKELFKE